MKHLLDISTEQASFIDYLTHLPRNILQYHDFHALPQMVLHHLGHDGGFSLKKAAYFVDNPDFDHFIGVAGFCKTECGLHKENLWDDVDQFNAVMRQSSFNSEVKKVSDISFRKKHINMRDVKEVTLLGKKLGMTSCQFVTWDMKHGNHGLLIFEPTQTFSSRGTKMLENVVSFLGFCPL